MPYEVEDRCTKRSAEPAPNRQGAVDAWRQRHTGRTVRIYRRQATRQETLIVEGTWHEAKRGA